MPQSVQPVRSNDLKFPHALAVRSEPAVKKKKENTEPPPLLGVAMVGTDVHASSSLLAFCSKIYVSPHLLARKVFPVTINTFGNRTVSKARVPCSPREGGLRRPEKFDYRATARRERTKTIEELVFLKNFGPL